MRYLVVLAILSAIVVTSPGQVRAAWLLDGTPISVVVNDQTNPVVVADGAGGAIIVWEDFRNDVFTTDIYAQRVDASGVSQWTAGGIAICAVTNSQFGPVIVPDGAGGAIIAWADVRSGLNSDIYAQRMNASGTPQWAANGVPLCTATSPQDTPQIVSDGAGGAIVSWADYRNGAPDVYVQRVNASGVPQWVADGVALCTATQSQNALAIVSDGAGGAIVTWRDARILLGYDVYARRVNASGVPQWTANGVAISTALSDQDNPKIVSDGAGGAIITWRDLRNGSDYNIYTQRVNASGLPQWTIDGVALCTAANQQHFPEIVSDGTGGAIVMWYDYRSGTSDIYAQRVSPAGVPAWKPDGVALCAAANYQDTSTMVADGSGGAILTWRDNRNPNLDIYAQRVDALGSPRWTTDGVPLCTAANDQWDPKIASDGTGNAIVTWRDTRGANSDMYAQRVEGHYGKWGRPDPILISAADVAHDQGGRVALNFRGSERDVPTQATIDFYSVWRAIDAAPMVASANAHAVGNTLEGIGVETAPGTRVTIPGSQYYWELVGTQTAYRWPNYSFSAATRADSIASNSGTEFFMVAAHELSDEHIAIPSNVVSGHSVDNLAPAAPLLLTAQRVGRDVQLRWNRSVAPDVRDYAIYRKSAAGVTPVPVNFLSSAVDTVLIDHNTPVSSLYYIVTASDVHENRSAPSNEASVQKLTGIGETPSIKVLTVMQNHPNPFGASTDLEIGLPRESDVSIQVYDVAGRVVRNETRSRMSAGWQHFALDARGDNGQPLASGVYFCRVVAAGETITKKMVIAR